MKLVAMVTDAQNIARYLTALGEPTRVPERSPSRGPPSCLVEHRPASQ